MANEMLPTTVDWKNEKVMRTIKNTVAQGATDDELFMFSQICQRADLDPFQREVWFIKTKGYTNKRGEQVEGKVQIMTGLAGFLKIANRHPMFDGMECEVFYGDDGKPTKAIAKVYRKDRKFPSTGVALWSEYYKPNPYGKTGVWEQLPSKMLEKCAKSCALREAFPQELNGLYTEDEMPREFSQPATPVRLETVEIAPATESKLESAPAPTNQGRLGIGEWVLTGIPGSEERLKAKGLNCRIDSIPEFKLNALMNTPTAIKHLSERDQDEILNYLEFLKGARTKDPEPQVSFEDDEIPGM